MLNSTAFSSIGTVLAALVNAGGVRPEDQADVAKALADIKAAEKADADAIADLQKRVDALEAGINGEAKAVTVITVAPPTVTTAQVGVAYTGSFSATGGASPYGFEVIDVPDLPPGIDLSVDGVLAGTPTSEGTFTFKVDASDTLEAISDPVSFTLSVAAAVQAPVETQPGSTGGDTVTGPTAAVETQPGATAADTVTDPAPVQEAQPSVQTSTQAAETLA